jgi:hypothetical protein
VTPRSLLDHLDHTPRPLRSLFETRAIRAAFARAGWHYTTAGRCAARYAMLVGCSQREAGEAFGLSDSTVGLALGAIKNSRGNA